MNKTENGHRRKAFLSMILDTGIIFKTRLAEMQILTFKTYHKSIDFERQLL